jgi:hypothetical protein
MCIEEQPRVHGDAPFAVSRPRSDPGRRMEND